MGEAFNYWTHIAYTKPEARALATRLGLDIPERTMSGFKCGLMYPMRRLVIAGEDTPANMEILFGPTWQAQRDIHKECRVYILTSPLEGSPAALVSVHMDEGNTTWKPRPPSVEEEEALQ